MNEEVFAKGFEKCRLLTRLLGQNVEKLDDYGCPKIQDLLGKGKTDSCWICSSYLFRHKTRLHCAERKAKVYRFPSVSGKGSHEPTFAYDTVRIHSLMIYTDIVEYNIVGETKAPLLRCFPFISKLKSGDIITAGQYMNYQTFSNLQFRRLLKNSFHSIHVDLRDTSG